MTTHLLAGGGTAGHVNPLLAVADRIRDRDPDARVLVLGTAEGLESRLVPERGYELLTVPRLPFPRRLNAAAVRFPDAWRRSVALTRRYLRERGVDVVVGFGGYASAPAYLAARAERVPFALHEANAKPGMANRLGARFTPFVGVAFPGTPLPHPTVVGMPLRREIESLDRAASRPEALAAFGLDAGRPVLLVTGGSLGARSINSAVGRSVDALLGSGWQVLHVTGQNADLPDPERDGWRTLPYCDRMDLAFAAADFVISRSGSATVSELTAVGLPAVYVPYPVGNGEQRFNAAGVVAAGGALLVLDAAFTPAWIAQTLVPLLGDRERIAAMAERSRATGRLDGADRMTDLVERALGTASLGRVKRP
ncbi:UDP-N-acetylglucosamine--N-acetylmuramyl-(pentapeptide) pyrophosphoryl-undecaprenol N-acetylglucosamine transferase [Galbitalea sp. SE-J8]|uniref:UDP-N-acetylglucosamine--N-acetylmuramyl- (pentapeptide) pyrophosphoryl-undecaprenol N-acetylglucosamine transferase n=1 Tax=Galbitalea sp. SE-J8 TaxID=3054952 RepID=UPI00259C8A1B|nr:UDP-N-acetylglucosamine--N-acetylmuramyl-(pentapeptide) pyrophosphoryl-undecaprenol N-acetylglucosamine transferase [Galbitalea sp. SE-J8]MDM4763086.1 UDP-N-acetylglucosamine--N-acetylmuramyl-(pentapeptide) pyrophosphoryl-undecaprenol N-acetylglucosamine transferase [Galbitalea sp. SE-J8]